MGHVKSVTAVSGCQTKVKREEVFTRLSVCILLILLLMCELAMAVSLQFKHNRIQVHVDMRSKQANLQLDSCRSCFISSVEWLNVAACQQNCFRTWTLHIRDHNQVQLLLCARFPLTTGGPCPNLREEGDLPVAKTTAYLYKLICVGGIVLLCRECSWLGLRSHPYPLHASHPITMQTWCRLSSSKASRLFVQRHTAHGGKENHGRIIILCSQNVI